MERENGRQEPKFCLTTAYTSCPTRKSTPAKLSVSKVITNRADSLCSTPELTTRESSTEYVGSPTGSKGTDGAPDIRSQRHEKTATSIGPPVFQLLQDQDVNLEDDIFLDQITTWVKQMNLHPESDRQKRLEKVFLDIEGMMAAGDASGQRQHPADRQDAANKSTNYRSTPITSRDPPKRRRREASGEESSQVSRQESESNNNVVGHRIESASNNKIRLSCPFVKKNPARYEDVASPCTERFGFPNPGRVVEHVKKYHSLGVPCCSICKQRFNGNKTDAERTQQLHVILSCCEPRELRLDEPEWMDEDQDARFSSLNMTGQKSSPEDKWRCIYRQIFGIAEDFPVPNPYYDYLIPSHLFNHLPADGTITINPVNMNSADTWHLESNLGNQLRIPVSQSFGNAHVDGTSSFTLCPPTAFLTAQSLDTNEKNQPEIDHYIVYQGYDSGYQSLGQESGLETIMPPQDLSEFVDLSDLPFDSELETDRLKAENMKEHDASFDLIGLEMSSTQFPDSAVAGRKKRKGFENEL